MVVVDMKKYNNKKRKGLKAAEKTSGGPSNDTQRVPDMI